MAVYSAIDATERTVGASSIHISGEIHFQNSQAPVRLNNIYAADNGSAAQVSLSAAVPVAFVLQSGFDALQLRSVALRLEAFDDKRQFTIESVAASRGEVHPGDRLQLRVVLMGPNGAETARQVEYQVPIGAPPGPLYFTVADANVANITDYRQILTSSPHSAGQLIGLVNNLHPNNKAYVRVWRANPAYQLEGAELPDPPASVALILGASQSSLAGLTQTRNAKVADMEIDTGDMSVSGMKTIQVEVKE
jgi:hypothetical protein